MDAELSKAVGTEPFRTRTRTSALFASAADRAVVLRRGPKAHWQLLAWDLTTDTVTPGQWMKGDVVLCDLSPGGDKLVYFAAQYHRSAASLRRVATGPYEPLAALPDRPRRANRKVPRYVRSALDGPGGPKPLHETWTAISTPPYFTALALWPSYGRWTGGGVFGSQRDVFIAEPPDRMVPVENVKIPARIKSGRPPPPTVRGKGPRRCRPRAGTCTAGPSGRA